MASRRRSFQEAGAALLAAVVLGGCGGGEGEAPPPALPSALAASLATRSDAVASALAAGDSCRASALTRRLQQETIAAVNAGRVPAALQEQLSGAVNELVARVRCIRPPQPAAEEPDDDGGKRKGKHKGHGKKHKGED